MSLDEDHAQVWFDLLGANANILNVFDATVPDPTPEPPFVVGHIRNSRPRDGLGSSLNGAQPTITSTATFHCVGLTPEASRAVMAQVFLSLLGVRPTISGRNCGLIKQANEPEPPDIDESTGRKVFDAIAEFDFTTTG